MLGTSPLRTTTPASVRTSIFFSCGSLPKVVSTALVICLSFVWTALRAAGATTCRSFFTLFTPSTVLAMSAAAIFASSESTLPRRNTSPFTVSTRTSRPLTRSSAKRAILVFDVSQLSLVAPVTSCVVSLALFSILSIVLGAVLSVALSAAPAVNGSANRTAVRSAAPVFSSLRITGCPPRFSICEWTPAVRAGIRFVRLPSNEQAPCQRELCVRRQRGKSCQTAIYAMANHAQRDHGTPRRSQYLLRSGSVNPTRRSLPSQVISQSLDSGISLAVSTDQQ